MLGHSGWEDPHRYALQTLAGNVNLLKPEVLLEINKIVVDAGHALLKKSPSAPLLKARCDSFVVETDVHYPTDVNLLWDAMRKLLEMTGCACENLGISGWRQYRFNLRQLKKKFRKVQNSRYSNAKNKEKREATIKVVHQHYRDYLSLAELFVDRSEHALVQIAQQGDLISVLQIEGYIKHAKRQIDQITRRVLDGEVIPHQEKVFSLFEPHTEWISKGKAGVPVELGVRVCILEDQHQFILHHRVMYKETDEKVTVTMVREAQKRFPGLNQCSFDKGFYTKENVIDLNECLDLSVLPKKGRLNKCEQEEYQQARRQHSAVESCINNLENRGLGRCLSYGSDGCSRSMM